MTDAALLKGKVCNIVRQKGLTTKVIQECEPVIIATITKRKDPYTPPKVVLEVPVTK